MRGQQSVRRVRTRPYSPKLHFQTANVPFFRPKVCKYLIRITNNEPTISKLDYTILLNNKDLVLLLENYEYFSVFKKNTIQTYELIVKERSKLYIETQEC